MKKFLIHNSVWLPIDKHCDKSEQKYIGSDISGNIYMNEILSESELKVKYKDNPNFIECKDLRSIVKAWETK